MERYPLAALVFLTVTAGLALAAPPTMLPSATLAPSSPALQDGLPAMAVPPVPAQPPAAHPEAPADAPCPACPCCPVSPIPDEDVCCPEHGRWSVSGEYLLWWVKNGSAPPLLTTGTGPNGGIPGDPSTRALFGGINGLDYGAFSGGRVTATYQPGSLPLGLQVSGFVLEQRSVLFGGGSDSGGSPLLARPVFNAQTGGATAALISAPGAFAGNVAAGSREQLWGVEGNATGALLDTERFQVNGLIGVRYVELVDALDIEQNGSILNGGVAGFQGSTLNPGSSLSIADHFGAGNDFVGGQVGAQACFQQGRVGLDVLAKVAVGVNHEALDVTGNTTLGRPGAGTVAPGGLLALPSNSGRFTQDEVIAVPEVTVQASYQVTSWLRASVGYDFLYMSDVLRAGDQVSLNINPRQVPSSLEFNRGGGAIAPPALVRQTDFWAQGLTFGLELRY